MVILVLALLILGPDQLPKAMRTFGNVMAEIRKVSGGFQAEMRKAMDTIDISGSDTDKPQSSNGPSTVASSDPLPTASPPEEADVTEVIARNPAASSDRPVDVVDPVQNQPAGDPADRAAG